MRFRVAIFVVCGVLVIVVAAVSAWVSTLLVPSGLPRVAGLGLAFMCGVWSYNVITKPLWRWLSTRLFFRGYENPHVHMWQLHHINHQAGLTVLRCWSCGERSTHLTEGASHE